MKYFDPPVQGVTLHGVYKNLIVSVIICVGLFFFTHPVYAAPDLTITCKTQTEGCAKSSDTSLFTSATVWYPGLSESHTIHIDNTVNAPRDITTYPAVVEKPPGNLDTVLLLQIFLSGSPTPLWTGTLTEFFGYSNTHPLPLTQVPANNSLELIYTITMDVNAGNEFQNTNTLFDLSFGFSGEDPAPISTPTTTPTPASSPSNVSNSPDSSNPSNPSNPTGAGAPFLPITQLVTRFVPSLRGPEVAGESTEVSPTPAQETYKEGEVAGATTCKQCIWWPILLVQIIITVLYYFYRRKNKKAFWTGGIVISIFTYALFLFFNRSCRNGWELWLTTEAFWCKYFILWVLLIFGFLSYSIRPKNEENYQVLQKPAEEHKEGK